MYVESCTILVVVNRLSRPVVVLDRLPGLYGLKYDSATACGPPLYLCSYKLVGSMTLLPHAPYQSIHPLVNLYSSTPCPMLYVHRALGEQASETAVCIGTLARVCAGGLLRCVWAIRFLGSVSTTAPHLHRNIFISFLVYSLNRPSCLLPGGRSRDDTTYIFLQ